MTITLVCALLIVAWALRPRPTPRRPDAGLVVDVVLTTVPPSADAWADLLDATAREVRSGTAVRPALATAMRRHPVDVDRLGATERNERSSRAHPGHDPDEAVVRQALQLAMRLDADASRTLQSGVTVLRDRAALRAEVQVQSAAARASARILTVVPVGFWTWSVLTSATFRRTATSPVGLVVTVIGLALNLTGWAAMRRIVRRATP